MVMSWCFSRAVALAAVLAFTPVPLKANTLEYPPGTADTLVTFEGAGKLLARAAKENVVATQDGTGVQLASGALAGSITFRTLRPPFPVNEVIPSWNGSASGDSGFRVWMRATGPAVDTPWIAAGSWGRIADDVTTRIAQFPGGMYDIDSLVLDSPATTLQFRVDLVRATVEVPSPIFRRLHLSLTNSLGGAAKSADKRPMVSGTLGNLKTTETLRLPFRSQVVPRKEIINRICAASSLSMILEANGVNLPTQYVAEVLYDPPADAFGVWNRVVQAGCQLGGLNGYITRYRSWDTVRDEMAKGSLVVASIRLKMGELRQPPRVYQKRGTLGHLIVINGFAPNGRIIVNNPASKDTGPNELWLQEDLARAWFQKGGVALVFPRPARETSR